MKSFTVGGYVRDMLLGLTPNDQDYVVVGETPQTMLDKGFHQVGGHFPVFLHPESGEEYALARNEVSTGNGYGDFSYSWEGVTLEEDLSRRDLTINAMALDEDGKVIDLFGGKEDLQSGILRHVSEAFSEDPLRVLRVARFAATYRFCVARETMALMKEMTAKGMLESLPGERVWKETEKALVGKAPERYFTILKECGALSVWFPELQAMENIPQRPDYHAEGDLWVHTMMVLLESADLSHQLDHERRLRIRLAALVHDLGKLKTPVELLWGPDGEIIGKHHGHEDPDRFGPPLRALSTKIKMPSKLRKFAWTVSVVHQNVHSIGNMSPKGLVNLYEKIGGVRSINGDEHYLDDIAYVCLADNLGRLVLKDESFLVRVSEYPQGPFFKEVMNSINSVDAGEIVRDCVGKNWSITEALNRVRAARRQAASGFIANMKDEK